MSSFLQKLQIPALGCMLLLALGACSGARTQDRSYPPSPILTQAPSLRQNFLQAFLRGRWCRAQSLFLQSQEYYLRQDDFCSVAQIYILAYNLHAYLGVRYPHLLDKAMNFAQQGLDCANTLFDPDGHPRRGRQDERFQKLMDSRKWRSLATYLKNVQDPLFASVYARKAAIKALPTHTAWAQKYSDLALSVDRRQGWVLFLIQDWKYKLSVEKNSRRRDWIRQRIATLYDLVEPCASPFMQP